MASLKILSCPTMVDRGKLLHWATLIQSDINSTDGMGTARRLEWVILQSVTPETYLNTEKEISLLQNKPSS
jgi:hypothetical protein